MTTLRIAGLLLLLAVLAIGVPLLGGPFWTALATQILIFGLLALSVDLLLGQAGLFSLTHASFFAVSAYTVAILQVRYQVPAYLAAPAGLLAGTMLGVIFGVAVRTRGVYFILISIAMGYVVWGMAVRWSSFTGGDNGITNVPPLALGPWRLESMTAYYVFVLAVVTISLFAYRRLLASPYGLALRGIKGSEPRMQSIGYVPGAHLYSAFVLSAFIASLAGVLYVYYNRFVNPVASSFQNSVEAALMAIIGGSGTIVGPFVGAAAVLGLRNWGSAYFEMHHAVMGVVFIATVLWAGDGIVGLAKRLTRRYNRSGGRA
ncbi:MAG: branched-chain amino acid ABC transporter permease [Comamonadaceae bacterium]|nr:MAG: branched-chain amino acid ABC transporter permease [Comamonadaceae bacterium]